jgi:hypothetical protein
MNLGIYADTLADQAALFAVELQALAAAPTVDRAALRALADEATTFCWGIDYLALSMALAGMVLRRGPDAPPIARHLARRHAALMEMAPDRLPSAEAEELPVRPSTPQFSIETEQPQ